MINKQIKNGSIEKRSGSNMHFRKKRCWMMLVSPKCTLKFLNKTLLKFFIYHSCRTFAFPNRKCDWIYSYLNIINPKFVIFWGPFLSRSVFPFFGKLVLLIIYCDLCLRQLMEQTRTVEVPETHQARVLVKERPQVAADHPVKAKHEVCAAFYTILFI